MIYTSRRHGVVLAPGAVTLAIAWVAAGVLVAEGHRGPRDNPGAIGVVLGCSGDFASRDRSGGSAATSSPTCGSS